MNNVIVVDDNYITINTKNSSYQMMVDDEKRLIHTYYGRRTNGRMDYLLNMEDRGFSGNIHHTKRTYSHDELLREYPERGTGDFRSPVLDVRYDDESMSWGLDLTFVKWNIIKGKYSLDGLPAVYSDSDADDAMTLEVVLRDEATDVCVKLLYGVLPNIDIITRAVIVENESNAGLNIVKCQSACLDLPGGEYDFIKFYGRHAYERCVERTKVSHGSQVITSRRGTSSHQYNPLMVLADHETNEMHGSCYAMEFVYSGGFKGEIEKDQYDQIRVQLGLSDEMLFYPIKPGEKFTAPEVIMSYSKDGLSKLSQNLHKCIRNNVCRGKYKLSKRPVLVNSWEAAYFDFNADTIVNLAKEAAAVGLDLVVMDDGWFGNRNDDNTSLGDWDVNETKLGCSLKELADRVNAEGVSFGIWIEPEMVNEDSNFFRENKDKNYHLQFKSKDPVRSRNQLVLDFSRKDVRDIIFDKISKVLESANIKYVKWDMNRSIADVYSVLADKQGKVLHDFVLGVYDFAEKLITRFPDILFEGCSGGGGRFDAGMMYYTPQIWCSDNTDAIDRLKIQYGTSFGYPVSAVGSHVSAVPNHQTGRSVSLKTRGIVAMSGTFGYELDLAKLSDLEKEEVAAQIKTYKEYSELIASGDYYRLSNPFTDEIAAWEVVAEDKTEALIFAVRQDVHANTPYRFVKVVGLEDGADYRETITGVIYSQGALEEFGIPIKQMQGEYTSYMWHLAKLT